MTAVLFKANQPYPSPNSKAVILAQPEAQSEVIKSASEEPLMFNVGDRVAVIHLHRVGKECRREAIRIDTVEKVTAKQIRTRRNSKPKADFKSGDLRPSIKSSR